MTLPFYLEVSLYIIRYQIFVTQDHTSGDCVCLFVQKCNIWIWNTCATQLIPYYSQCHVFELHSVLGNLTCIIHSTHVNTCYQTISFYQVVNNGVRLGT